MKYFYKIKHIFCFLFLIQAVCSFSQNAIDWKNRDKGESVSPKWFKALVYGNAGAWCEEFNHEELKDAVWLCETASSASYEEAFAKASYAGYTKITEELATQIIADAEIADPAVRKRIQTVCSLTIGSVSSENGKNEKFTDLIKYRESFWQQTSDWKYTVYVFFSMDRDLYNRVLAQICNGLLTGKAISKAQFDKIQKSIK